MNGLSRKENDLYKLAGRHIGEHTHTPNYLTIVGADPDLDPLNPAFTCETIDVKNAISRSLYLKATWP